MGRKRVRMAAALVLGGSFALAGCAPSLDTDDSGSIAVVEEFFAHLEAGESEAAAALTSMDFDAELVDDEFYAWTVAKPTDAHIVETTGYDGAAFTATVEYLLDDAANPRSMEISVREHEDELKVSGWRFDSTIKIGPHQDAGLVRVNGEFDYTLAEPGNELLLLPGTYTFAYLDSTGLLEIQAPERPVFLIESPNLDGVPIWPRFKPDVEPSVEAEIERLQGACAEEAFTGPSCPQELTELLEVSPLPPGAEGAEWFRKSGPDIVWNGDVYIATASYTFWHEDLSLYPLVSFTGTVERADDGRVTFSR